MGFLIKLIKQGKLELVEPNEEIKNSYLRKSESNFISAKLLFDNHRLEEAISLAYYNMYNLVLALLFRTGIKSENHTASLMLLKNVFDIDNSFVFEAKKERIDKQYYVGFHIKKEQVKNMIDQAGEFNAFLLDFIERLNHDKILNFRKKFKKMI